MAKAKTFADKTKKHESQAQLCPVCGSARQAVRTLTPEPNAATGYFKFRDRMVMVCKCNHKDVYES